MNTLRPETNLVNAVLEAERLAAEFIENRAILERLDAGLDRLPLVESDRVLPRSGAHGTSSALPRLVRRRRRLHHLDRNGRHAQADGRRLTAHDGPGAAIAISPFGRDSSDPALTAPLPSESTAQDGLSATILLSRIPEAVPIRDSGRTA